ncbi:glycosyltransferase family 2 protein [Compostibacter hankyongensis]|uniref:Glycosyltransferase family 2 protein n=1 Tax=Compostibacter hankyongensis TaxID=1007089 RepID=A0ABP8FZ29_9BACT
MSFPAVAVVILNWNGRSFLERFLPSVCASTYPNLRIYVADNASTDDSIALVTSRFPQVTVIRNTENEGFAGGYNRALRQVDAAYYVLLNQDVEVEPGWIEPVIALLEQTPRAGAAQPKLRSWHNRDHFEYAGAAGGWIDRWGFTFCRGRLFDTVEPDHGQYNDVAEVFWASGAALFVKASLYRELGGLDADFFAHMEEVDLCWRLQRAGYRVLYCPDGIVYHVGGGSLPQGNPRKVYLNFRNNLMLLHKNLPRGERRWVLPVRLMLDGFAAIRSLLQGRPAEVTAILRAHRDYYKWRKTYRSPSDRQAAPLGKLPGAYTGSIIVQYFLLGRKRFSRLSGIPRKTS